MYANEKEHPCECSLILLWVKNAKCIVLQDIKKPFARTFLFGIAHIDNLSKQANTSKQPANRDYTAAAEFAHHCLLVRRILEDGLVQDNHRNRLV